MKTLRTIFILLFSSVVSFAQSEVYVEGGRFHVQGIAYDRQENCMYFSFTSTFLKADMNGNVVASVSGINGHIGAMVFDPVERKVYASLELKDDSIGKNVSKGLGDKEYSREESVFYIAQIDVDKLTELDMPEEKVMRRIRVEEACQDYQAKVRVDSVELDHRFACSGIDGMAIAPAAGVGEVSKPVLYVAYGIYGDVNRCDNDYNILLTYSLDDVRKAASSPDPVLSKYKNKYFIHTGNTNWGVQNMTYDAATGRLYLAVYKGKKPQWPNHSLFVIDLGRKPLKAALEGVPYFTEPVSQLEIAAASDYKWGSTGLCAIGNGRLYVSENGKKDGIQYCRARIIEFSEICK